MDSSWNIMNRWRVSGRKPEEKDNVEQRVKDGGRDEG